MSNHSISTLVSFYNKKLAEYALKNRDVIDDILVDAIESNPHGVDIKASYINTVDLHIIHGIMYSLQVEGLPKSNEMNISIQFQPSGGQLSGIVYVDPTISVSLTLDKDNPEIYQGLSLLLADLKGIAAEVLCPTFFGVDPTEVKINDPSVNSNDFSGVHCMCSVDMDYITDVFGDPTEGAMI